MNLPHKGKISITLPSSGGSDNRQYVNVEMVDEKSRSHFFRVRVPIATWTLATVGSLQYCDCEFELNADYVGMRDEHKTEIVMVEGGDWDGREEREKCALEEHEVDGWRARGGDISNHYNARRKLNTDTHRAYEVAFFRYIEEEEERDETETEVT